MKRKYAFADDFSMTFEQFYNFLCVRGKFRIPLRKLKKNKPQLIIYFGVPGCGKTTLAAALSAKSFRHCIPVYSNVDIKNTFIMDPHVDIGEYAMQNCKVIIDEAGIEYNNRNIKTNFTHNALEWFKTHRHYKCSVDVFSQSFEDMDITLRRLAQKLYVVRKSLIPYFIVAKPLKIKIGPDENGQLVNNYSFYPLGIGNKYYFAPLYWKSFNSFSTKKLKPKVFKFNTGDEDPAEENLKK